MAAGQEALLHAQGVLSQTSSTKHCTACKNPVKGHVGPCGEDRCVVGNLDTLRLRIDHLETTINESEARHAEELADQVAFFEQRLDGLLAVIESLSAKRDNAGSSSSELQIQRHVNLSLKPGCFLPIRLRLRRVRQLARPAHVRPTL